ncbi:unnamed protein product [Periconia digitata]|uniref:RRM domain-containing protein n=1 Tax=Periconia digitata TaxID=1303443 RepID=A0A9W4XJS9_9PLEO|nr:unnamed protein product [Periconia digitata]
MAPPAGANGIIPVTAIQQKNSPASAPRGPKALAPRLKLVLRRLPPGLTKPEFDTLLGDEWKVGGGKIDWLTYKKGKISKDVAKPSRPSRAYIHVTQNAYVASLSDHVREVTFHDAAKSFSDNALVGPPVLEYAPYPKIQGGRRRNDARQGTIDQDPEFKEFLESLTAPLTKPAVPEADAQKEEKVKTTPLIEALREKKANKDKPQGKNKGRGEAKETAAEKKLLTKSGKDTAPATGEKNRNSSKAEKERAQKEAVKALNKEAALRNGASSSSADKTTTPAPERKRGNMSIAKSILHRDLGLTPASSNKRRGTKREVNPVTQETPTQNENTPSSKQKGKEPATTAATPAAATPEKTAPASTRKERPSRAERRAFKASLADKASSKTEGDDAKTPAKAAASAPTILKKPQAAQNQAPATTSKGPSAARPPTEPSAARNAPTTPQTAPARPANPTPAHASQTASNPTPTGKQAFLKHANASQGITETLIEEALKSFGAIDKVEIDKRKGFAYVDFAETEGLIKAIAASPVKVAQGAVQVLERKEKVARNRPFTGPPTGPASRGRGGFGPRGRGGRGAGARSSASGATGAPDAASAAVPVSAPAVSAGGDATT